MPKKRKMGKFTYCPNNMLDVSYLLDYAKKYHVEGKEHQTLVVIDEAGVVFNARDWQTPGRRAWLDFFALHRHFGFDFIMISQKDAMIDKQIRGLLEYDVIHRKCKNAGLAGFFLMFLGNFVAITKYYGNKTRIDTQFIRYHKKIASIYDTFALFDKDGQKVTADSYIEKGGING